MVNSEIRYPNSNTYDLICSLVESLDVYSDATYLGILPNVEMFPFFALMASLPRVTKVVADHKFEFSG